MSNNCTRADEHNHIMYFFKLPDRRRNIIWEWWGGVILFKKLWLNFCFLHIRLDLSQVLPSEVSRTALQSRLTQLCQYKVRSPTNVKCPRRILKAISCYSSACRLGCVLWRRHSTDFYNPPSVSISFRFPSVPCRQPAWNGFCCWSGNPLWDEYSPSPKEKPCSLLILFCISKAAW